MDEPVAVMTNHDGQPVSFDWRGSHYLAVGIPIRWYMRKSWWSEVNQAPKGSSAQAIEVEMWRVRAQSETDRGLFELRHNSTNDEWKLVQVI